MGAIERQAMSYVDTFSDSEMKSLFGSVLKPLKRSFSPQVSRYMVSVGSASTGLLLQQLGLRSVKFYQRHDKVIIVGLCILGWALALSGKLALR